MRPLWRGSISFGLVNIPVSLYSAIDRKETIDLDMLRDSDHSRIRYKRVAEKDGKEVPFEHIVKGYEYEKDKHIALTPEDFQKVPIKSNQTVDIREFVNLAQIEPRYYEQPYFLAPDKNGAKAYVLLKTALEKTNLAGVAKVVIRPPREHLALVTPLNGLLMLETLHFADELRDPAALPRVRADVGQKELDMALSLVNSLATEWDPAKYHDEYHECLMEIIRQKIRAGTKRLPAPKRQAKAPDKVLDLIELLQDSLGEPHKRRSQLIRHPRGRALRRAA